MFILMKKTMQASPHGHDVMTYQEGEVYEVPESLGETMIREKWAVRAELDLEPEALIKNEGSASENKDAGSASENKSVEQKKNQEPDGSESSSESGKENGDPEAGKES